MRNRCVHVNAAIVANVPRPSSYAVQIPPANQMVLLVQPEHAGTIRNDICAMQNNACMTIEKRARDGYLGYLMEKCRGDSSSECRAG